MAKMHKVLLLPNPTKKIPREQVCRIIEHWEAAGCALYTLPEFGEILGGRLPAAEIEAGGGMRPVYLAAMVQS